MDRIPYEELTRIAGERYPDLVARFRPYRGHQRPRDRGEAEVLIALAVEDWRRGEREGRIRWLPDGRLALNPAAPPDRP